MPDAAASEGESEQSVGRLFKAVTMLLLVLAMLVGFLLGASRTRNTAEQIGAGASPVVWCLIILAVFSIWKRGRTQKTRYRIVFCCSLLFLFVDTMNLLAVAGDGSGRHTGTPPAHTSSAFVSQTHEALRINGRDSLVGTWRPVKASTSEGPLFPKGRAKMQFREDGTLICKTDYPDGELQTVRGKWQRAGPDVITYSFDGCQQVERQRYEFQEGHLVFHHLDCDVTVILERIDDFSPH